MIHLLLFSRAIGSPISIESGLTSSNLGRYGAKAAIWAPLGRTVLGAEIEGGSLRNMNIGGFKSPSGERARARAAVLLPIAGADRFWFDVALTAGLRGLWGEGRSAVAVSSEVGPAAHLRLGERLSLSTTSLLPLAVDVSPSVALARFPGLVLGAGAQIDLHERWSLGLAAFAGGPEGYNGDSEKGLGEARLTLRFDLDGGTERAPLLPSSI